MNPAELTLPHSGGTLRPQATEVKIGHSTTSSTQVVILPRSMKEGHTLIPLAFHLVF